ncbi:hypothetical protein ATHL_01108 [Anaerolinea thermolimosa]|nr:hypothetical protein ATHL_01108 [Anaerolinea thermolimosa]
MLKMLMPNLRLVFWVALFWGVLALGPTMMNVDGDLGRHLTIGEYIIATRSIPTTDLFSHTMTGQELTPHEWMAQISFALAYRWMGLNGVVLLTAIVIATAFTLVFQACIRASQSLIVGLFCALLAIGAASLHWLTRPHIFTFLFLVIWVRLLDQIRHGKWQVWVAMPFVMGMWANFHGAFVAGFAVWVLFLAGQIWERWIEGSLEIQGSSIWRMALGGLISFLATLINPVGFRLWSTSLGYVSNAYLVGHTAEYLSPDFHHPSTWPFLLMIGLALLTFGLLEKRLRAPEIFLVCGWLVMGLYSQRNIPLSAIIVAPVLAIAIQKLVDGLRPGLQVAEGLRLIDDRWLVIEKQFGGWLWAGVVVVLAGLALNQGIRLDFNRQGNTFDARVFPVAALDWVEENPQSGKIFNYFPWGGYLLYRAWPGITVFIDGQTDFYGETLSREYEQVLTLDEGWQEILARYDVQWVLMPTESALVRELRVTSGWKEVYRDNVAVILHRLP